MIFWLKPQQHLLIATTLRSWQLKEDTGFSQNKEHPNACYQNLFFVNFNCMILPSGFLSFQKQLQLSLVSAAVWYPDQRKTFKKITCFLLAKASTTFINCHDLKVVAKIKADKSFSRKKEL